MSWSLEKRSTETYVMRWRGEPRHCWWAVIFVDTVTYCLSIQSDFGDYSYRWSSIGDCFKKFLVEVDDGYLIDKLSYGRKDEFYVDESTKALRAYVDELKAGHPNLAEVLDEAFDEVKGDLRSSDSMYFLVNNTVIGDLITDHSEWEGLIKTGPSYQLLAFVKEIWPGFREILKKELEPVVGWDANGSEVVDGF